MKVDHINNTDTEWHDGSDERWAASSALEVEFNPSHGPRVRDHLEPPLGSQLIIFFETARVSADRMLHITPDEIRLELKGRFLIQASDVWPSSALPSFMRCQQYIEGKFLLNLGRGCTFRVEAILGHGPHAATKTPRKDLRVTIRFLGYCDFKEGLP